jgi:hypothetical protein
MVSIVQIAENRERQHQAGEMMRYKVTVNFEGPVNAEAATGDRRTLEVDGTGQPPESSDIWRIRSRIVWPQAPEGSPDSADLRIEGPMGGWLQGAYHEGAITTITDQDGASHASRIDLRFEVAQSGGRFAGAGGTIRLTGTVEWQGFRLSAQLDLDAPEGAWLPPNASVLGERELASGASPVGPQAGAQEAAERRSEESLRRGPAEQP